MTKECTIGSKKKSYPGRRHEKKHGMVSKEIITQIVNQNAHFGYIEQW